MCNLTSAIAEGSEYTVAEIEEIVERERVSMDCKSGHCSGCPYEGY